jgi:hypothetical protein
MGKSTPIVGQHIFSQILSLSSKDSLGEVFRTTSANKWYKSIKAWDHFATMMFCVMAGCSSLREITMGLEAFGTKLNHLNLAKVPARSTLADANKNRPASVFAAIYSNLCARYRPNLSDSTLPASVIRRLFIIDSTTFPLFKAILKGPGKHAASGKRKGGIKKNTVLSGASLMPTMVRYSAAADNDLKITPFVSLPPGSFVTFDRGYTSYRWYAQLTLNQVFFITRQREDAGYESVSEALLDDSVPSAVMKDETIRLTYRDSNRRMVAEPLILRRIAWWDEKANREYVFITNNFDLDAATIAGIYQYRWQIELFFKKLKQNFQLQYFVGDNQNAIEIQIWCALIGVLLLSVIHHQNSPKLAFSNVITLLRIHLTGYISIAALLALHSKPRKRPERLRPQHNLFTPS